MLALAGRRVRIRLLHKVLTLLAMDVQAEIRLRRKLLRLAVFDAMLLVVLQFLLWNLDACASATNQFFEHVRAIVVHNPDRHLVREVERLRKGLVQVGDLNECLEVVFHYGLQ